LGRSKLPDRRSFILLTQGADHLSGMTLKWKNEGFKLMAK
jgi:hypothetical protein